MRYEEKIEDIVVPVSLWRHPWLKKNHHAAHAVCKCKDPLLAVVGVSIR
jgi:hypothetical protein